MEYVIVTGMSGAGKSTALKIMEDIGYFCVDNFPIPLLEKFVEFADSGETQFQRIAFGMDIRNHSESACTGKLCADFIYGCIG